MLNNRLLLGKFYIILSVILDPDIESMFTASMTKDWTRLSRKIQIFIRIGPSRKDSSSVRIFGHERFPILSHEYSLFTISTFLLCCMIGK